MKLALNAVAAFSLLFGLMPSMVNAAPSRELKIDSILLETIDLTREVVTGPQTIRLLKVCIDGQAYFIFASKPPSVAMSSVAPVFKDGKPETCSK